MASRLKNVRELFFLSPSTYHNIVFSHLSKKEDCQSLQLLLYLFQLADMENEANFHYTNEDSNLPANVAANLRQQQSRAKNDRLYAVLYTSGSTGCPKGARIVHSAILNRLMWQWEKFPYQPNDVCVFKVGTHNIFNKERSGIM